MLNECTHTVHLTPPPPPYSLGSDVFSTSTDGQVLWWDIRKLVEPVETLPLQYSGYKSGLKLGGIVVEYESTMVSFKMYHTGEKGGRERVGENDQVDQERGRTNDASGERERSTCIYMYM